MKIGIEAQRIFRKNKHGMDMVALELIRNLQLIDTENEYYIFVRPGEDDKVISESPNFRIVRIESMNYATWEQVALPAAAKKHRCGILHCTSNTAPVFCSIPLVVTLHDVIYMESSVPKLIFGNGSNYQKFGNVYRKMIVPTVVKKAEKIITVSDYEKNRISEMFGIRDEGRLMTIYNGMGSYFRPVTDAAELDRVKTRYGLPGEFFFFLGNRHPKKNTRGTLKAFSDFIRITGRKLKLVVIDYEMAELQGILDEIGDPGLMEYIVIAGYVENTDLPAIYSQCKLFLYPSLRESFGIPIIEAMACGAPVITSDTSSMPEISGKAAALVDPYDPGSITGAMIEVDGNPLKRDGMIREGFSQSVKFSWRKMAESVLGVYHSMKY